MLCLEHYPCSNLRDFLPSANFGLSLLIFQFPRGVKRGRLRSFFSLSVGIYCYSFALRTALAAFRKCWHVVFLFSFLSGYLLTPLWISSLTHLSFKSMLFDFHIVMDCLVFPFVIAF